MQHLLELETSNTSNLRQGVALLFRTQEPARISLTLIKYECMVYIEPFYGGYYVWRLTAKSKQAVCYVFIEQKVGCASQLDGETIPSAYRRLVPSNRGDVYVYSWHLNCTMWDVVN